MFNPKYILGGALGVGTGVFLGTSTTKDDGQELGLGEKLAGGTIGGAVFGAGGVGIAAGHSKFRSIFPKQTKPSATLGDLFAGNTAAQEAGRNLLAAAKSPIHTIGSHPMALAGIGAGIGALVDSDDRGRGALIGAAAGGGLSVAAKGYKTWSGLSHAGKLGAKGAIAAAVVLGVGALAATNRTAPELSRPSQEEYYGYSSRLASMKATGDVVLGLHRGRHG